MRTLIDRDPYADRPENAAWYLRGSWPCAWIDCPDAQLSPSVSAYRRRFVVDQDTTIRVHVSADERYELFLDGVRIGRGSERGEPRTWFFETYDLTLQSGPHVLVALVWAIGHAGPYAQMSVYPGFLLAPQDQAHFALLGTGVAQWEAWRLPGYRFVDVAPRRPDTFSFFGVGANVIIDGHELPWGFEQGEGDGWTAARVRDPGYNGATRAEYPPAHMLQPATLPPMLDQACSPGSIRLVTQPPVDDLSEVALRAADHLADEQAGWSALLAEQQAFTVEAHTRRRLIIDLGRYTCAYPELVISGGDGSTLRWSWAEALYREPGLKTKGNRSDIEGKYFAGLGDTFLPDGGQRRVFRPLWWGCGRYVELFVSTAAEALTIEVVTLSETRYPLEMESTFAASDARMEQIVPIMVRALQMCAHESYMDCPYYEQLMYAGDTRLEVLTTYVITRDDRLPRKALHMFDVSRLPSGLTQSRYPSRVSQIIPPFSLWWVAMLYDYSLWRDDLDFVRAMMPGVRGVLDRFYHYRNADGLVQAPPGWNFTDWAPEWGAGVPPDGELGVSGVINWHVAFVLTLVARMESWMGEPELAARAQARAQALAAQLVHRFWDEQRGLFADDLQHQHYSEHMQCLALLSGLLDPDRQRRVAEGLLSASDLTRTTIYFSHYLFETYALLGRIDAFLARMELWFGLPALGFTTTPEQPEPSRSDCHAWGSHPLYHYYATVLGIRPTSPGFATVEVRPQLGSLTYARGTLVHPQGEITVNVRMEQDGLHGRISLPAGVQGQLMIGQHVYTIEGSSYEF